MAKLVRELDGIDKKILNVMQWDFPLVVRPFEAVGGKVGISEDEAINRILDLKKDGGIVRQISAIFDTRALGYKSSLVAMRIDPNKIANVAQVLNKHPGVSHNYKRNHAYNLWFTIAVPPDGSLERDVEEAAKEDGVEKYIILKNLRLFKISVKLDMTDNGDSKPQEKDNPDSLEARKPDSPDSITQQDKESIRELQKDLEIAEFPFVGMAKRLGTTQTGIIDKAKELIERGFMRRFSGILRHRKAGFSANGMAVWVAPEDKIEQLVKETMSFPQISHCYQRPTYPDWPYNLFTMIHAKKVDQCKQTAEEISNRTGITRYDILFSTKEYKKDRVRYFVE